MFELSFYIYTVQKIFSNAAIVMALIVLLPCLLLLVGVSADKIYTVVANQSATSCSGDHTHCSLMYYAANPSEFLKENNTTFVFLPGDHLLVNSTQFLVANVSSMALHGTNAGEVAIVCNGEDSRGFKFLNITNLTIRGMSLKFCSKRDSRWFYDSIAIYIWLVSNLRIDHITVHNTPGIGLSMKDTYGITSIANIVIESSHNTTLSKGINFFYECSDTYESQMMTIVNSSIRYGSNNFDPVAPSSGAMIDIYCLAKNYIIFDNVFFSGNGGKNGGNVLINLSSWSSQWKTSVFILNSWIHNGTANLGGGLFFTAIAGSERMANNTLVNTTTILHIDNTSFQSNTAFIGGGVYLKMQQNSQEEIGKVLFENCTFKENKLVYHNILHGGAGVHILTFNLPGYEQHNAIYFEVVLSSCAFLENSVQHNTGYSASQPKTGSLFAESTQHVTIINCRFISNNCSGVVGIGSNFLLYGKVEVRGNSAPKGAGIFFCSSSMMHIYNGTQVNVVENHAELSGGGVYVEGVCSPADEYCFFQVDNPSAGNSTLQQTQIHLINNTARAGSAFYGQLVDWCILFVKRGQKYKTFYPSKVFNDTFHIQSAKNDLSIISSDPISVGFCKINASTVELNLSNCPLNYTISVKPGKQFHVFAAIMGQRYGLVAGLVLTNSVNESCEILRQEYSQYIDATNTNYTQLTYTILSKEDQNASLKLVTEDYYSGFPTYQYLPSYLNIIVEKCPLGFIEQKRRCSCLPGLQCSIENQTVYRLNPHWIGYKEQFNDTTSIILHPFCPLGYCLEENINIHAKTHIFYQDTQCEKYRTGLLCGKCKETYSLGFGSSQCLAGCSATTKHLKYFRILGL